MQAPSRFLRLALPAILAMTGAVWLSATGVAQQAPSSAAQPSAQPAPQMSEQESVIGAVNAPDATPPEPSTAVASAFQPGTPLTLHDRFTLQMRTTFAVPAFIVPAFETGILMAHPPRMYPPDWSDGGGAFGRNYGAQLARHTASGLTHFAVADVLREDPRYYPSESVKPIARLAHALVFTLVDRSDSGRRTVAVSNLSGAAAGGFVGMTYFPPGFDDVAHALQHGEWEMGHFAARNLLAEFAPQISHLAHKLHFPDRVADGFLPPDHKQQ